MFGKMKKFRVFVGTYSQPILFGTGEVLDGKGKGIHQYELDSDIGSLTEIAPPTKADNPSYLTISPNCKYLYAVNELKKFEGCESGAVSAYELLEDGKTLKLLNQKPTGGTDPCYVGEDLEGRCIVVANYMSGSVCSLPVEKDGRLGEPRQVILHHGRGGEPERQAGPHAHSVVLSPGEKFAFVSDLGIDKVKIYLTDFEHGRLKGEKVKSFCLPPKSGPRICEFNRRGDRCYLFCEISSEIWVLAHDGEGNLEELQRLSSLRKPCEGGNLGADLHLSPDGNFLYATNRGQDSIVSYRVLEDGRLKYIQTENVRGKTPRNFGISPDGRWILVGNQDSNSITIFRRDEESGRLFFHDQIFAPTPVCIRIEVMPSKK